MKKLFVLVLVALIAACAPVKKDQAIVKGKLVGSTVEAVKIFSGRDVVTEMKVGEDGSFTGTLNISDAIYYSIRVDRDGADIYLKPGTELTVNCDFTDGKKEFTFVGELAKENEYLKIKRENNQLNYRTLYVLDETAYNSKMDSLLINNQESLTKYTQENKLDEQFIALEKEDVKYSIALITSSYERGHAYFTQNKDFKVSENFNDRTAGLEVNNEKLLPLQNYQNYISNYLEVKVAETLEGKEVDDKKYFDEKTKVAKDEFTAPKVKAAILFGLTKESIKSFGVKSSDSFLNEFKSNCKDASKLAQLDKMIVKYAKTDVGAVAPDFTLTNLKGEEVTLSSLKGKVVVVDFWATWCNPCKVSFPGMQKAVDTFKDVEFLFVNTWERVPNKKENAEKFMTQNNYNLNVLVDDKNEVVASYNVSGIPTKYLIDKDGKIKDKKVGGNDNVDEIVAEIKEWIDTAE